MSCAVDIMEWSNKMDLIAYGTEKGSIFHSNIKHFNFIFHCPPFVGEVIIQRLNWQKIVTFPSPGDDIKVKGLSWQHDETIVAVGRFATHWLIQFKLQYSVLFYFEKVTAMAKFHY